MGAGGLQPFRSAGRALLSLGLVRGSEGNLSTFDGRTLRITRTGAELGRLGHGDVLEGRLEGPFPKASSDLRVHRDLYHEAGPGAIAHAHPPGIVPRGGPPGVHGTYAFASNLEAAVEEVVRRARLSDPATAEPAATVRPLEWRNGALRILDQTGLPDRERYRTARGPDQVAGAIRVMAVRGAPVLGIAAGYGMALAARRSPAGGPKGLLRDLERAARQLEASRPTAVNISWAVGRTLEAARGAATVGGTPARRAMAMRRAVLEEAERISGEDRTSCEAIGRLGAELVPDRANILTHCNTGALATGGWGTAQGVIVAAHLGGKDVHVWVDETRPLLQGARLTAWELQRLGIPMTLIADSAAGSLMAAGRVDLVLVGADRIAANGDVANKVGTYGLAVLARQHGIPFYVAAPLSTVDFATPGGDRITIEQRAAAEITIPFGVPFAPRGSPAANPAFDVTPARLVSAVVTDRGLARRPLGPSLRRLARQAEEMIAMEAAR